MQEWDGVDGYIVDKLLGDDRELTEVLEANAAAGLPAIDVSPAQGKLLHLLARCMNARRVLEVGTLGGYSTIWLVRALPGDGHVVTLELDPHHAEVARANFERARVNQKIDVREGPALKSLEDLAREAQMFDLVFIDADKQNNARYVQAALEVARSGALIIVDNVVREGRVLDERPPDPATLGTRQLFDMIAAEPRLDATAIQTVGVKKWDGFLMAIVK